MRKLTVATNLHCQGCVDKITPLFNQNETISDWAVDLNGGVKTLSVTGTGIGVEQIDSLLQSAGYAVIDQSLNQSFWSDLKAWKRSSFNTLNCLIGCSIGDFGMVIFLQAYYPQTTMLWQMTLAVIAGLFTSILLETTILKYREHFNWSFALKTAFGMSFISMVAMELAMTSTDFMITGGQAAFSDPLYWIALIPALIVGFVTPLPYNYYKLKKFNKACH